ncbi:L-gulonolactone oxidase-like [Mytilus galloprovincialis]|uniref:L-gulonolactone oxidase-like n=1 Tax=Mytilus galloprovincialis TaxID=29158 RepID=UPI003F7BAD0D
MADKGFTQNVLHVIPDSIEQLKDCLEKAQQGNRIAIPTEGSAEDSLAHRISPAEKITIVDISFLKKDDIKWIIHRFKKAIENNPPVWIETFRNWGQTQTIPVIASVPMTLDQLKRLLKVASEEKLSVRCAGSGHSWSPIFSDRNNVLIYMENIKSDYEDGSRIRISPGTVNHVDVMAGVTTRQFKEFQLEKKLNIPANVILEVVQMISVVATGCHGVGYDVKAPSDYVVKMRIMDAKGNLKTFQRDDNKMFKAIQANFGCFGVIYDMTIELKQQDIVKVENQYRKLKDIFYDVEQLNTLFEENMSVELFWFPFNSERSNVTYNPDDDEVWVRVINKVGNGENVEIKQKDYYNRKDSIDLISEESLYLMSPTLAENPSITPLFSWSSFTMLKNLIYPTDPIHQELPNAVHFRQHIRMAPMYDMEFAFDLKNYQQVKKIIEVVVLKVQRHKEKGEYPLNIALEMRMMGYSDALLCPASIGNPAYNGSRHVLYVEVISVVRTDEWEQFCQEVALEWMKLDGVPHLAKQWDFIPGINKHINERMKGQIDEFKEQLKKSECDPDGMFLNETLKKLLQL